MSRSKLYRKTVFDCADLVFESKNARSIFCSKSLSQPLLVFHLQAEHSKCEVTTAAVDSTGHSSIRHLWGGCDFDCVALIVILLQQVEVGYVKVHCAPSRDEAIHLNVSVDA